MTRWHKRAPQVAADPVRVLRERNEAAGLRLDAHTTTPGWLGERLDVGYAIDVLHPLAAAPRQSSERLRRARRLRPSRPSTP